MNRAPERLTVVICTWNRADVLDQTLAAMRGLTVPSGTSWTLLVVNNNSTDHTDAVIARYEGLLPIRRLFEPVAGQSMARNRALSQADGDLVIWTDDDVLVGPGWLEAYVEAAREHPEVTIFGGPVLPWFETPPPAWAAQNLRRLEGPFAVTDPEEDNRMPIGANMAFRGSVLTGAAFDAGLGRAEGRLLSGDETAVIERLEAEGHKRLYVRAAVVRHLVPARRVTPRYVWDWFYHAGRSRVRMEGMRQPQAAMLWGAPRWAWRAWAENLAVMVLCAWRKDARWLRALEFAARHQGLIAETRALGQSEP